MPTTITKSIGSSGRDYATITDFMAALPANLVTANEAWIGECYNDSEFNESWASGSHTTDATRNITLRCASGQGFAGNAGKLTNALRYNQSNGVGVTGDNNGGNVWYINCANFTLDGLQFKLSGALSNRVLYVGTSGSACVIKNCIVGSAFSISSGLFGTDASSADTQFINCLAYYNTGGASAGSAFLIGGASIKCIACTAVNCASGGTALVTGNLGPTIQDCIVMGFNTLSDSATGSGGNNLSDAASGFPGSNNLYSKTTSSQFQSITAATPDFRIKAAADAINAGVRAQTYTADLDIVGSARSTSTPTIGAWEYAAAVTAIPGKGNGSR